MLGSSKLSTKLSCGTGTAPGTLSSGGGATIPDRPMVARPTSTRARIMLRVGFNNMVVRDQTRVGCGGVRGDVGVGGSGDDRDA